MLSAFIAGLAGTQLDAREAALLREARPCGVILFARNVESPEQVRRLTGDVRAAIGADDLLVLIDQEGGRVQRLRPPHWRALPPAAAYGRVYQRDPDAALRSARLAARLTAADLVGPRHQHRLRAGARRARPRQPRRDRRPRVWLHSGSGGSARPRRCRRIHGRRRAARHQAHPGAWPRHQGQPPRSAGGHGIAQRPGGERFRRRSARWPACPRP